MADFQAFCRLSLGEAHLAEDRLDEAQALAERTLAHARAHQERGHEAYALRLLGDIVALHESLERGQAEVHYQQALTLADDLGMRPLVAHCHRALGALYAKIGRPEQARAELSTAMVLYHAMEMTLWPPQVEAALVQIGG
jgi:tetratricopeptide (TPR) repeat protein